MENTTVVAGPQEESIKHIVLTSENQNPTEDGDTENVEQRHDGNKEGR
jgi:hypothetical protein